MSAIWVGLLVGVALVGIVVGDWLEWRNGQQPRKQVWWWEKP